MLLTEILKCYAFESPVTLIGAYFRYSGDTDTFVRCPSDHKQFRRVHSIIRKQDGSLEYSLHSGQMPRLNKIVTAKKLSVMHPIETPAYLEWCLDTKSEHLEGMRIDGFDSRDEFNFAYNRLVSTSFTFRRYYTNLTLSLRVCGYLIAVWSLHESNLSVNDNNVGTLRYHRCFKREYKIPTPSYNEVESNRHQTTIQFHFPTIKAFKVVVPTEHYERAISIMLKDPKQIFLHLVRNYISA